MARSVGSTPNTTSGSRADVPARRTALAAHLSRSRAPLARVERTAGVAAATRLPRERRRARRLAHARHPDPDRYRQPLGPERQPGGRRARRAVDGRIAVHRRRADIALCAPAHVPVGRGGPARRPHRRASAHGGRIGPDRHRGDAAVRAAGHAGAVRERGAARRRVHGVPDRGPEHDGRARRTGDAVAQFQSARARLLGVRIHRPALRRSRDRPIRVSRDLRGLRAGSAHPARGAGQRPACSPRAAPCRRRHAPRRRAGAAAPSDAAARVRDQRAAFAGLGPAHDIRAGLRGEDRSFGVGDRRRARRRSRPRRSSSACSCP